MKTFSVTVTMKLHLQCFLSAIMIQEFCKTNKYQCANISEKTELKKLQKSALCKHNNVFPIRSASKSK